jgi:hypothetical protein
MKGYGHWINLAMPQVGSRILSETWEPIIYCPEKSKTDCRSMSCAWAVDATGILRSTDVSGFYVALLG